METSPDWFLYDNGLRYERVQDNCNEVWKYLLKANNEDIWVASLAFTLLSLLLTGAFRI